MGRDDGVHDDGSWRFQVVLLCRAKHRIRLFKKVIDMQYFLKITGLVITLSAPAEAGRK